MLKRIDCIVLFSVHHVETLRSIIVYTCCLFFISCIFYLCDSTKCKVIAVIEPYCEYTEEKSVDSIINMEGWGSVSCSVHKHASLSFIHTFFHKFFHTSFTLFFIHTLSFIHTFIQYKKYVHLTKQPLMPYCLILE